MARILITAAIEPDLDGVSCAIAYALFLQTHDLANEYVAAFQGEPHSEARFVLENTGLAAKQIAPDDHFDHFILVDASEPYGLPETVRNEDVSEVIDHRMFADWAAFPDARFRVEPVGAAATQIAEFYYFDRSVSLSPAVATLLLCGIVSNTVNFKADTTTFRDERMQRWLQEAGGGNYAGLPQRMYDYKSRYALDHLAEVLKSDAKDSVTQFALPASLVAFQIETSQASALLARESEMITIMQRLFPERQYQLLMLQDAAEGTTYLISAQPEVLAVLKRSKLTLEDTTSPHVVCVPHIVMRKSVIQAAKEAAARTA